MMGEGVGLTKDDEVVMMAENLVNGRDDEEDVVMVKEGRFVEIRDDEEIDEVKDENRDVAVNGE